MVVLVSWLLEPLSAELSFEPLELEGVSFVELVSVPDAEDVAFCSGFCSDFLAGAPEPWSFL